MIYMRPIIYLIYNTINIRIIFIIITYNVDLFNTFNNLHAQLKHSAISSGKKKICGIVLQQYL